MTTRPPPLLTVIVCAILACITGLGIVAAPHPTLAAIAAFTLIILALRRPESAIPMLLVFATSLGLWRRAIDYALAPSGALDPLVLVIPAGTVALGAIAIRRGALRERSRLTNIVLLLGTIALIGAMNPLQGSPVVGLGGLLFFGVPYLWFFIGSTLCADEVLGRTYRWVAATAFGSSVYGLVQSSGRFTAFDRAWSEQTNFKLGGELRPFGWANSPGEYTRMIAVAAVITVAILGQRHLAHIRWFAIPLVLTPLFGALLFAGVRSTIVYLVLAIAVSSAAHRRSSLRLTIVSALVGLALLVAGASALGGSYGTVERGAGSGISRQLDGLSDPANSTATVRVELLGRSIVGLARQPIGSGTGATTRAAAEVANQVIITESDLGDAAVSWGIPGVILMFAFVFSALRLLYDLASRNRDWLARATLAIFVVATLRWVNGALYPLAPLVLLGLGWADRRARPSPPTDDSLLHDSMAPAAERS